MKVIMKLRDIAKTLNVQSSSLQRNLFSIYCPFS